MLNQIILRFNLLSMRSLVVRSLLFFSLLLINLHLYSQQIDSMMEIYAAGFPKEKIHVHFDKQMYNPDETVWYKVYLLSVNELSALSKNIYVEWYDASGKLIKQTVAPLFQSSAKGSFDIPAGYKGSFIHMKAFTRWMLNEDPVFLYEKFLTINAPLANSPKALTVATKLEFFPEGGSFVEGLVNRVAYKATNSSGMPVHIKGILLNNNKEVLDSLKDKHDGMGVFNILPNSGELYQVSWTDEYGQKGVTPLPTAKSSGVVMNIKPDMGKAIVTVQRSANASAELKQLHLLVHMNQELLFKVSIKMNEKLAQRVEIPIEEIPSGILQFTLFTTDWLPASERIMMVNNHTHEFNAKINPIIVGLDKRAKNVFEILVSDTLFANMSLAVTDAAITLPDQQNIFSDFLLSSELKGYIHNPAYYFKSDADSITSKLDLVMMTNGWRRFDWEKIRAAIPPQLRFPPEASYMSLKGKVFGNKSIATTENLQLNFVIVGKDSSKSLVFTPVQKDGSFEESGVFFYDTAKVYYNFNGNKKIAAVTQVKVENGLMAKEPGTSISYAPGYPKGIWSDSLTRSRMTKFLTEQENLKRLMASASLQEVIVKSRVKNPLQVLDEKYASGLFSGGDSYSFDLTDDKVVSAFDIFTFLQGRVPGLQISMNGGQSTLSWRGSTPDLYLNEMISDPSMIQTININDVAYIKVMRPPFFGSAGGGAGGAIAIYTKKGSDLRNSGASGRGMESTILGGYSRFKEFYSPSYDKTPTSYEPDIRNTLYWNPYIITNKKTPRFRVEFYNNDLTKKMQVVLEGVNAKGQMLRVVKMIE